MTKRQRQLDDFIRARFAETGVSPSMREMSEHLGLKSTSGVHRIMMDLVSQGRLQHRPYHARSVIPTDPARMHLDKILSSAELLPGDGSWLVPADVMNEARQSRGM